MRTDAPRRATALVFVGVTLTMALSAADGHAQLSVALLDEETEVRSIDFRFEDSESFPASRLRSEIAMTERGGLHGVQAALSFLPLVREPRPNLFAPLALQRDVARLRRFYRAAGFPDVTIRYEVTLDEDSNVVDIDFVIAEGSPTTLASLAYETPTGAPPESLLAPDLAVEWTAFTEDRSRGVGIRFGEEERLDLEVSVVEWLRDRGYPFAVASTRLDSSTSIDPSREAVSVAIQVDPGPRSRIGGYAVEGSETLSDHVFVREFRARPGDWYSARRVRDGRLRVLSLPAVASVVTDVEPAAAGDSTVSVVLRLREARKRRVSGTLGYTNVGGVAFGGQWDHFNFLGGARTFTAGVSVETGWGAAFSESDDRYSRASLSLRQPFVFVPGLSFLFGPFAEYRDDYRDRSWEAGVDLTAVYQYARLQAVSLRYRLSRRDVLDYPISGDPDDPLLPPGTDLDGLRDALAIGVLTFSGTFSTSGELANPTRGLILQPILEITGPGGFPTNEYFKADVRASVYQPLGGGLRLAASTRIGRMFPFGHSDPGADESGLTWFLQLRDVSLTAGGPADVRGWGSRLLGPKLPNLRVVEGPNGVSYEANRYLPLGGLARVSGAVELVFPLPGLPEAVTGHAFVDGARVWTPDTQYTVPPEFDESEWYYSTGLGIGVDTPAGPIRLSLGYKLNPSPLDLRAPGDVLGLLLEGRPIEEAPPQSSRRFQLHLTVGRVL